MKGKFDEFKAKMTDLKNHASPTFNSIKDTVVKCFEGIKNGIKAPINGALGFVEKFINNMIEGFNKMISKLTSLKFDVPDWVPGIGGEQFSLKIPELGKVSLPRLAEGGILTQGTAMVGEAGPEMLTVKNGQAIVQPLGGSDGAAELTALLETCVSYLAQGQSLYLDGNTLVGKTASRMNNALGNIAIRSAKL